MAPYTIEEIRTTLKRMDLDRRVRRIILFGSHANGTAHLNSDLDFYLDSGQTITGFDYFALKAALEDAFARDVDLVPDVDVAADSRVAQEIREKGITVYVS